MENLKKLLKGRYDWKKLLSDFDLDFKNKTITNNYAYPCCDPKDINTAIEYGLGWGEGPYKLADDKGIDNLVELLEDLHDKHEMEMYEPCLLLKEYAEEGRGFYE